MKCINNSLCMRIECSVCCFAMFYSRITISFIFLTFFLLPDLNYSLRIWVSFHSQYPMIQWFKSLNFKLDSGYKTEENTIKLWFSKPVQQCERFLFKSEIEVKKKKQQNKKHHHLQCSKVTHTYKLKFMKNRWIASCKCIPDKVLNKDESPTQCDNRCARKN